MQKSILTQAAFSCGGGALEYLSQIDCRQIMIISDNNSEFATEISKKAKHIMENCGRQFTEYTELSKKPTISELLTGIDFMQKERPDTVLVVGEDSTINAAKIMLLLYEYPDMNFFQMKKAETDMLKLKTKFIIIPVNSGNATGISQIGTTMVDMYDMKE